MSPDDDAGQNSEQPGKSLVSEEQWISIANYLKVSERERQVCQLLFEGMTRAQIAYEMDLKLRTIRHYLERLHAKLSVSNRVQLVLRIIQVRDLLKEQADDDGAET